MGIAERLMHRSFKLFVSQAKFQRNAIRMATDPVITPKKKFPCVEEPVYAHPNNIIEWLALFQLRYHC